MSAQKIIHKDLVYLIFVNFANFSFIIFWDQNVPIPSNLNTTYDSQ